MSFKSWFDGLNIWLRILIIILLIVLWPIGIICLIIYLVSWAINSKKKESPVMQFEKYIEMKEDVKNARAKLILPKDEIITYAQPSSLYEERAIRNYVRTGHSIRIAKGWWFNMGSGQAESHGELRKIDSGILYITSKRVIYAGQFKSYNYSYKKLLSIEPFSDSVRIAVDGRQKTLTFTTENPILLGISLQNLSEKTSLGTEEKEAFENELKKTIVAKLSYFGGSITVGVENYKEMADAFRLYAKTIDLDAKDYAHEIKKTPSEIIKLQAKMLKFADILDDREKDLEKIKSIVGKSASEKVLEQEMDKVTAKNNTGDLVKNTLKDIAETIKELNPEIVTIGEIKTR